MTSMAWQQRKKNWQVQLSVSTKPPQPKSWRPVPRNQADDNTSGVNTEIKVNGRKLETVTSFKNLGSVITDEGSKPEILSRIAQTAAALTRFNQFGMAGVVLSVPRYH